MAKFTPKPPPSGRNRFDQIKKGTKSMATPIKPIFNSFDSDLPYDDITAYVRQIQREMGMVIKAPERVTNATLPDERQVSQWLVKLDHNIRWDNVIGADEAKTALRGAVEDALRDPELYKFYEMTPPRGVLLYGPPGNGKTLLAKATARALADAYGAGDATRLLLVSGPELQSKWFGETEQNIRNIFRYAREYKKAHNRPLIVFMDEADTLLGQRENGSYYRNDIVSQFLSEMDGLRSTDAFFILATNRPDALDEAFLRDGRIDRKIKVPRIKREDVGKLLVYQLEKGMATWAQGGVAVPQVVERIFSPELLLRAMTNPETNLTHHFNYEHIISGALIEGLVKRAKAIAFARDKLTADCTHIARPGGVTTADFLAAIDQSFAEEKDLPHHYAVQEFIEEVALPAEKKLKQEKWN